MNKVLLLGRLIRDVELKFIPGSGMAVGVFTIATDKKLSKEKKAEFEANGKPTADFIRCKAFGKTSETISQYFEKGSKILVEGSIDTGSYKKDDGSTVYTTEVLVSNFEFVESKTEKLKKEDFSFDTMDEDNSDDAPWT